MQVSLLRCWRLNFTRKRNKKRPINNNKPCSMRFLPMLRNSEQKTVILTMPIPPTLCVLTLSKAFVKKERSVSTLTILLSTELNKSICTSIKELSYSWMQLEEKNSVYLLKNKSTNNSVKSNEKWWRVPGPKSSANSSLRLLKKANTDGNGIAPTVKYASINIVFLLDTCSRKTKKAKISWKSMKLQLSRKSMLKDTI